MREKNVYDEKYAGDGLYWGLKPSEICFKVIGLLPPERSWKLLDIGCGEGRNALFFARNGYDVSAFDLSARGVEKTRILAEKTGVTMDVFADDLITYRLKEEFDILFSTGVLHYVPKSIRRDLFDNYKKYTRPGGLNVFSVFVEKPFIPKAPDAENKAQKWISGELFGYYHDWIIEYCTEEIFDCMSGGIPHRHAVNRIVARKPVPGR
jgi:tellurite methyltransferase